MRLIVMGTGPFAVPTLRALESGGDEVAVVVSRPPRGRRAPPSPVHQAALEMQLDVWQPETVNATDAQARLSQMAADLLVVCDYGEILRPATLATTRLGGINLHGSLLPKYRGAAPVQWALLHGETETGNSVIQLTPGLDAGPCLAQQVTPIGDDETAAELEARLATLGADLVVDVVGQLAAGQEQPVPQDASLVSKAPRLRKQDGLVDWSCPARQIKNQVRALLPWPRAHTFWLRVTGAPLRLNLDRVSRVDCSEFPAAANPPPGTVLVADKRLIVQTGDGALEVLELQPAGKRSMQANEFLRGNQVQADDRLGVLG